MTATEVKTDVLIIGGGGAGFRAVIGARKKGAEALLLSKGPLGRCGATPMAGADYTVDGKSLRELGFYGEPLDSKETFFEDIVKQGFYLNNQKLLEQYVRTAPLRLKEFLDWGVVVARSEEGLDAGRASGFPTGRHVGRPGGHRRQRGVCPPTA